LIFTNDLTQFIEDSLHYAQLSSDHGLILGHFTCRIPSNQTYTILDWDAWRKYIDEETAFSPVNHGCAYREIIRLSTLFNITKTSSYRRKQW